MRGLGETVAILGRAAREAAAASEIPPGGAGRLVETTLFGSNPGGLKMLSYAPEGLPPGAPLVVVLHGCSQSGPGYAVRGGWIELADRLGFAVLAPEQTTSNNLNRCFNWFSTSDIERDRGEPASIAQMIHRAVRAYDLDPQRVFITGLSAGGAMSAVMLATYPELFAGGAIVAGLPYGVATNMHNALRVMRQADGRDRDALGELVRVAVREAEPATLRPDLRLAIWQGDADATVDVGNADDLAAQWTSVTGLEGAPDEVIELDGYTRSIWGGGAPGAPAVEMNIVHGLGHGAPLATEGEAGLGASAPFMIDVGLSSTLEIARFWGLEASPAYLQRSDVGEPAQEEFAPAAAAPIVALPGGDFAAQVIEALDRQSGDIHDAIVKSLRTAGLMR